MTEIKDRGNDAPINETKGIDLRKFANAGEKVSLTCGEFVVRDLPLRGLLGLADKLSELVELFQQDESKILVFLKREEVFETLKELLSISTGEPASKFHDMTATDFAIILATLKAVIDWEKIAEVFTQLGLTDFMTRTQMDKNQTVT